VAVSTGHADIVEALLGAKADANAANENGQTPLYAPVVSPGATDDA
jgi:ankyrin repeat protein